MSELKKLKKSVNIESCYTQSVNGQEPVEVQEETMGSLYHVDNDTFIIAFESDLNGSPITTTVKVSGQTVSIVKIGDVHSRQTFCEDEWYAHQYFYGGKTIVFRNYTKKLDYSFGPNGGVIELLYELWSGETHLGFYHTEFYIR